jgi:hypothetical protein
MRLYVQFKDTVGNVSTTIFATITLDTQPPSASVNLLSAYQNSLTFDISWSGTDALSGITNYDVQYKDGAGLWTDWQLATVATTSSFTGQNNHTYSFRARARDNVGNLSGYSAGDTQTTVDTTMPSITSVVINGGAITSVSTYVSVTIAAIDPNVPSKDPRRVLLLNPAGSGIAQSSFSNDGNSWSSWLTYTGIMSWTLSQGDGSKTVYGRVKDTAGNISSVVSGTITLDTTVGTDYGMTINNAAIYTNQTVVTLTVGARPATAQMMVSNDGLFQGANWEPYASRKSWMLTEYKPGVPATRLVYIKYQDVNGNISGLYNDEIILDVTPPTGSVTIVGSSSGVPRRPNTVVTLNLSATDDVSGVGTMMLSNRSDFVGASWQTFVTSVSWNLGSNNTVYVRFKDNAGNVSQTYFASVSSNGGTIFLPFIAK